MRKHLLTGAVAATAVAATLTLYALDLAAPVQGASAENRGSEPPSAADPASDSVPRVTPNGPGAASPAAAITEATFHDAAPLASPIPPDGLVPVDSVDPETGELRVISQAEEERPSERYADLLERAEAGDLQAQLDLGKLIFECAGHRSVETDAALREDCSGVPEAEHEVLESWWIGPAQEGNAEAQRLLADVYPYGSETNIHWNRMAAQGGDVNAQVALGRSLLESDIPGAGAEAMVWFRVAAQAGDATAYMLAEQLTMQLTAHEYQQAMFRLKELGLETD